MPGERVSMRKIREVLRLRFAQGLSQRAIGSSLRLSTGAVNACLNRARRVGLDWPLPEGLDDHQLEALLYPPPSAVASEQRPVPDWAVVHRELRRPNVTLSLLWEEYRGGEGAAAGDHALSDAERQARYRAGPASRGGVLGAYVLTELPLRIIKPLVTLYLVSVTALITYRLFTGRPARHLRALGTAPVAAVGGFLDAVGGGGWGPIVTSTLVARGDNPRYAVGSASLCEFLVTMAISAAFFATLELGSYWRVILGLVIGGAIAAPFAGWFSRVLPQRVLMGAVAVVVGCLAIHGIVRLLVN